MLGQYNLDPFQTRSRVAYTTLAYTRLAPKKARLELILGVQPGIPAGYRPTCTQRVYARLDPHGGPRPEWKYHPGPSLCYTSRDMRVPSKPYSFSEYLTIPLSNAQRF